MLDQYHIWKMFVLFEFHKVLCQVQVQVYLFFFSFGFVMKHQRKFFNDNKHDCNFLQFCNYFDVCTMFYKV